MKIKFKWLIAASMFIASALTMPANAQFVGYQSVPQPMPSYSGIAPSSPRSSSPYGYSYNYAPTPAPAPQKEVKQVTMYKVENNGNLTKCLGKVEISNSGVVVIAVRENGTWLGTRGIVYAIDERDPLYQYFDYHVRITSGQQYLF